MNAKTGCPETSPTSAAQPAEAFAAVFDRLDLFFVEPKIVTHLVPDGFEHEAFETGNGAGHLFMRVLEDTDTVGTFD